MIYWQLNVLQITRLGFGVDWTGLKGLGMWVIVLEEIVRWVEK